MVLWNAYSWILIWILSPPSYAWIISGGPTTDVRWKRCDLQHFTDRNVGRSNDCDRQSRKVQSTLLHAVSRERIYQKYDDDDENEEENISYRDNDWIEAELFLKAVPCEPSPNLTAEQVARIVIRSLQLVDYPTQNAGLQRCFEFMTFDCRKAVTGRQGATTMDRFVQYGTLSPALQPIMGAKYILWSNATATYTPAQPPYRGALASFPLQVIGPDIRSVQYASGLPRPGVASENVLVTHMILRLEEQRRPPCCWLVKELLDIRYAFAGDMGNAIPD